MTIRRHILGGAFEAEFGKAIERMQARPERLKPCIVVVDTVTDRFFQCKGGMGTPVWFEVPWVAPYAGNGRIDPQLIRNFLYVEHAGNDGIALVQYPFEDYEVCALNYEWGVERLPPFARRVAEEVLRLPKTALLEIREFEQREEKSN